MSKQNKIENLKKNIQAVDDKIKKLSLQRELYSMTLEKLENSPDTPNDEVTDS